MLCFVYKSPKKDQTYLYLAKRGDFSPVPAPLLETFGAPVLVMPINLSRKQALVGADITRVSQQLHDDGYYLQLPPPPIDHLAQYRAQKED
jgi:uncharacterized protein YcgL (UPF0745 family)